MPRLYLSAAHKSSGKTTVSIGLCAALTRRGLAVQPFKRGPDYIDPMWLSRATGRCCENLDFHVQTPEEIAAGFAAASKGADISLIEGNKGLYDGMDLEGADCNAALAKRLDAPVVLVLDTQGLTRGVAPLVLGYQAFDPELNIAGVILNKVGGPRHEEKLRAVLERYTDIPVIGAVPRHNDLEITERHLGLIPSNENADTMARIDAIAAVVGGSVDLDRVIALGGSGTSVTALPAPTKPRVPDLRIGVARDAAFGFYYPGDLAALEAAGAELVFFDATRDTALPDIDGLFIGGGFPETQAAALAANGGLKADIKRAIDGGLPAYAECGGLMYLTESIEWQGVVHPMVGVISGRMVMGQRPQGRGYVRLRETGNGPWPLPSDDAFPAHEFHYSRLLDPAPDTTFAWEVVRGFGIDGRHDGIVYRNLLAGYAHLRHVDGNPWADRFAGFVRSNKQQSRQAAIAAGRG